MKTVKTIPLAIIALSMTLAIQAHAQDAAPSVPGAQNPATINEAIAQEKKQQDQNQAQDDPTPPPTSVTEMPGAQAPSQDPLQAIPTAAPAAPQVVAQPLPYTTKTLVGGKEVTPAQLDQLNKSPAARAKMADEILKEQKDVPKNFDSAAPAATPVTETSDEAPVVTPLPKPKTVAVHKKASVKKKAAPKSKPVLDTSKKSAIVVPAPSPADEINAKNLQGKDLYEEIRRQTGNGSARPSSGAPVKIPASPQAATVQGDVNNASASMKIAPYPLQASEPAPAAMPAPTTAIMPAPNATITVTPQAAPAPAVAPLAVPSPPPVSAPPIVSPPPSAPIKSSSAAPSMAPDAMPLPVESRVGASSFPPPANDSAQPIIFKPSTPIEPVEPPATTSASIIMPPVVEAPYVPPVSPPPASTPMAAPTPPPSDQINLMSGSATGGYWEAAQGADIHDLLSGWADKANVAFVWNTDQHFAIPASMAVNAPFEKAVEILLNQYSHDGSRPVGTLYKDPKSGRKVLVITATRRK